MPITHKTNATAITAIINELLSSPSGSKKSLLLKEVGIIIKSFETILL